MRPYNMRQLRFLRAAQKKFNLLELAEHQNDGISDLVHWLNGSKGTDQYERIEGLIRLIAEVRKEIPPVSVRQWIEKEVSADSGNEPAWEKVRRINELLRGYAMWPRYTTLRTQVMGVSKILGPSISKRKKASPLKWEWWPEGDFETKAAHQVIRLEEDGLLESLLPCAACKEWFLALRDWQKFCSDRCRSQYFSSSSEGRAKRARYMREYRKRLQRRDEEIKRVISRKKLT